MGSNPGEGRTKNLRKQIYRSNIVGLMFRRVVYTLCTQPCITIIDGDPMDTSVVGLSLTQAYLYIYRQMYCDYVLLLFCFVYVFICVHVFQ